MPFIGIISDEKTGNCIRKEILETLKINENSIIVIKEKNIDNIKNIKFDLILINKEIDIDNKILKKILNNSKYLVINIDTKFDIDILENNEQIIITYGFNTKADITTSSVEKDEMLICVQKDIRSYNNKIIEPQEIKTSIKDNSICTMAINAICIIV